MFLRPIFKAWVLVLKGFPGGASGKESPCNAGDTGDGGSFPGLGRFSWRRAWQPTPVFLPGGSRGQRSLAGYSPQDCKESDTTQWLSTYIQYPSSKNQHESCEFRNLQPAFFLCASLPAKRSQSDNLIRNRCSFRSDENGRTVSIEVMRQKFSYNDSLTWGLLSGKIGTDWVWEGLGSGEISSKQFCHQAYMR